MASCEWLIVFCFFGYRRSWSKTNHGEAFRIRICSTQTSNIRNMNGRDTDGDTNAIGNLQTDAVPDTAAAAAAKTS